jgi:hypothetical protein
MDYMRIGTTYYKIIQKPLSSGDTISSMVMWSVECIKQDHGKDFLASIPRYDGFCLIPAHIGYERIVQNFYNRYNPFNYQLQEGFPKNTLAFLSHIFCEQLDQGLDYLKILLLQPTQMLPILCLVSSERSTGKTTFLNYLKAIFGDNMTINSNEDFRSNFNAEWAQKLIIGVDETFLDRKEDSERLKNLSTSKYYKVEAKGIDRQEIEFFGKFILCSNNEDNFIFIDKTEIRYWIRKIPPFDHDNTNLLAELKTEIPYFLNYLVERPYSTSKQTRMWFTPEQIATSSLLRVKLFNRNKLESEIAQLLLLLIDSKENTDLICFCLSDIQDWFLKRGIRGYDSTVIKKILQDNWKLKPAPNSITYLQHRIGYDGTIYEFNQKGRFYQLTKKEVLNLNFFDEFDEKIINSS